MSFPEKDAELQRQIIDALLTRKTINMNKEVGVAYLQPEWEDKINPTVTVTVDEIKKVTGREKLRDVVLNDYVKALSRPGLTVTRSEASITVGLTPEKSRENKFDSLDRLHSKNIAEIADNPELGEPPY